jgi:hypothetical protein
MITAQHANPPRPTSTKEAPNRPASVFLIPLSRVLLDIDCVTVDPVEEEESEHLSAMAEL